jgi:PAS domain S-box-containing protein
MESEKVKDEGSEKKSDEKAKTKILVVDDEKIITMHLEELLTNMGYDVVATASTGAEAKEKAREFTPDLIFMDIIMPGEMTGIDAATEIKKELGIPVIYLTAFADDHIVEKAKQSEPFNFLVKPFKGHELRAAIEIAIYRKKMEKALEESEEKYRTLVEESRDGIAIIQDGIFKYLNPALLDMLRKPKDIDETFFLYYFMDDCRERAEELYYRGMEGHDIPSINEFSLTRNDGSYLPVETNATKVNFEGRPAMLSFFRSMEERKTIERMLDYLVQEINERNQIAIPNIEKLMNKTKDKKLSNQLETVQSLLFDNANAIKKAYKLLQMDDGRKELLYADPIEKINEAINVIIRQYPERDIKISTHIQGTVPAVLADEFLEDVFYILFEHAVRHLEEDPVKIDLTINVEGKKEKEHVEIKIHDNSHTLYAEEKAFEPFSINQENTSVGSGLSIVKSIMDRFSGEIKIENMDAQDPDSDSVFVLNLKTEQNSS